MAALPTQVHFRPSARPQTFHLALGPGGWHGGHQVQDVPVRRRIRRVVEHQVALQQHLGDAGERTEVAIDLERRMRIEQVQIGAPTALIVGLGAIHGRELLAHQAEGVIPIVQPRPTVDLPRFAPAGAFVSPQLQALAHRAGQFRRAEW